MFEFGLTGIMLGLLLLLEDRDEGDGADDEVTTQQSQHLQTQSQLKNKNDEVACGELRMEMVGV